MARTGSGTRRPRAKTTGSADKDTTIQPESAPKTTKDGGTRKGEAQETPPASEGAPTTTAASETPPASETGTTTPTSGAQSGDQPDEAKADDSVSSTGTEDRAASASPAKPAATTSESGAESQTATPAGRRSEALPMILGGIVAVVIATGAVFYFFPHGWQPTDTSALEARIAALEDSRTDTTVETLTERVAALEDAQPDLQPIDDRLSALEARDDPSDRLDALEARIATLEDDLAEEVETLIADALDTARDRQQEQEQAIETAQQELQATQDRLEARAALARLEAAAESGDPAPDALAPIAAITDLPEGLDRFRQGIPELRALQADFPDAARAALAAAPMPEDTVVTDRVVRFLRNQTGARSLVPREGDDADAILSRAEAHLRASDLSATLRELDNLPEPARDAMADWRAQAETRQAAMAALAELRTRLTND
ncbi:MAG: hypothetical protein HLUCCA12_12300 [Rhodobacteraceae bacterium HLUCCA12]|nr:MAG: hypothetical protein HLUCCA12_12300 [Rhodobacteraceae bacterium HLUCCA12]